MIIRVNLVLRRTKADGNITFSITKRVLRPVSVAASAESVQ